MNTAAGRVGGWLPDKVGLYIKNQKVRHIPKKDYKKVTLIHEVPALCRALFWELRSGSEQDGQGLCSLGV